MNDKKWLKENMLKGITREELTHHEIHLAMNSISSDLEFTIEKGDNFMTGRIPTLLFEIRLGGSGIHLSSVYLLTNLTVGLGS